MLFPVETKPQCTAEPANLCVPTSVCVLWLEAGVCDSTHCECVSLMCCGFQRRVKNTFCERGHEADDQKHHFKCLQPILELHVDSIHSIRNIHIYQWSDEFVHKQGVLLCACLCVCVYLITDESKYISLISIGHRCFQCLDVCCFATATGLGRKKWGDERHTKMCVCVTWGSLRRDATPPPPNERCRMKLRPWIPGRVYLQGKKTCSHHNYSNVSIHTTYHRINVVQCLQTHTVKHKIIITRF